MSDSVKPQENYVRYMLSALDMGHLWKNFESAGYTTLAKVRDLATLKRPELMKTLGINAAQAHDLFPRLEREYQAYCWTHDKVKCASCSTCSSETHSIGICGHPVCGSCEALSKAKVIHCKWCYNKWTKAPKDGDVYVFPWSTPPPESSPPSAASILKAVSKALDERDEMKRQVEVLEAGICNLDARCKQLSEDFGKRYGELKAEHDKTKEEAEQLEVRNKQLSECNEKFDARIKELKEKLDVTMDCLALAYKANTLNRGRIQRAIAGEFDACSHVICEPLRSHLLLKDLELHPCSTCYPECSSCCASFKPDELNDKLKCDGCFRSGLVEKMREAERKKKEGKSEYDAAVAALNEAYGMDKAADIICEMSMDEQD